MVSTVSNLLQPLTRHTWSVLQQVSHQRSCRLTNPSEEVMFLPRLQWLACALAGLLNKLRTNAYENVSSTSNSRLDFEGKLDAEPDPGICFHFDPEGGSQKAALVVVLVVISSLETRKAFLMCSGAQRSLHTHHIRADIPHRSTVSDF